MFLRNYPKGPIIEGMEDATGHRSPQYAVFPEAEGKGVVKSPLTGNALFSHASPSPVSREDVDDILKRYKD